MSKQPWKTKDWYVSPWNFEKEVTEQFSFPKQVKIHDITLRDGEQQTGLAFDYDDKIRIAEALAEAGVHRIEAGMPVVSAEDERAIKDLVKRNLGPQIFSFARCMKDDVQRSVDTGVSGVVMEVPSSPHIIEYAYKWPLEKAIETSIEATQFAHEQGLEVVFFPIDFTRSEMGWVMDLICRVAEGVEVIHSTVLGVGERAGNTPMEETVLALLTMYDVDCGLKYNKLNSLARTVREVSGQAVPTNKPVVGDQLFEIESGIIASWLYNCGDKNLTELFPYRPELVGRETAEIVMGKGSGIDSIKIMLEQLQIRANEEEAMAVLQAVKKFGLENKRLLTNDEFRNLANDAIKNANAA